jgi:hypothetical protein
VIVGRSEPRKWFTWHIEPALLEMLLETGLLVAVDDSHLAAGDR